VIVTRTPLRICLGGGGTDLPNYAAEYGGFVLSATIDAYVYVVVRPGRLDGTTRYSYNRTDTVGDPAQLTSPIVREAVRMTGVGRECDMTSSGAVPAGTGLGSSGAFTVGLLAALYELAGRRPTTMDLVEQAWQLEHDHLDRPVGKHDPYVTGLGGLRCLHIDRGGGVRLEEAGVTSETIRRLGRHLLLFYTGRTRDSAELLGRQDRPLRRTGAGKHYLHTVKRIGQDIMTALRAGDLTGFGELLDAHWQAKRTSSGVSNPTYDEIYALARRHGATGGKILGAGGGGFFLFYAEEERIPEVTGVLTARGLREMPFEFEQSGTTVLLSERKSIVDEGVDEQLIWSAIS
jgi:D-glycero-alpha-D-manno-heptose-7-phosphate kinase